MPQRRTITVLGALVMGMTLTSGLLLLLQPGPVAPVTGVTLQSVDRSTEPRDRLFNTAPAHPWQAIVIHDSGSFAGSARTINALHAQAGLDGLGYHFVINNGQGADDGLIEVGFRWQRQTAGNYVQGQGADWFNRNAIGICLVGDTSRESLTASQLRELVWLVQQLQMKFGIPAEAVYVETGRGAERRFPDAWFTSQLLRPDLP